MIETTIHMYIRMWCKMTLSFRSSLHTYCCCIASQIGRRLLDAEFLSPRGGKYVSVCKTCGKLGGSEGHQTIRTRLMSGNIAFLNTIKLTQDFKS